MSNHIINERVELSQKWVDLFLSTPSSSADHVDGQRAAKRRKIEGGSPSTGIPVLRAALNITSRVGVQIPVELQSQSGIEEKIALSWKSDFENSSNTLEIVSRSNPGSCLKYDIVGANDFTKELKLILEVVSHKGLTGSQYGPTIDGKKYHRFSDLNQFHVSITLNFSRDAPTQLTMCYSFELRWYENTTIISKVHTGPSDCIRDELLKILRPDLDRQEVTARCSPQDFYRSAFATDGKDKQTLHIDGLAATPYPFQQRAIRWLLHREGVEWVEDTGGGFTRPLPTADRGGTDSQTLLLNDSDGQVFYFNSLLGVVSRDDALIRALEPDVRGGILAEEMGLGKTVEIIALILLHRRPELPPMMMDFYLGTKVRPTLATLIVTPPALLHQWVSELQQHAPHLNVMVYDGIKKSFKNAEEEAEVVADLAAHDVVITTYHVLRKEIHFAVEPPKRSLRGERKFHRPKSPLIQLSWWRICLDEAQEIDSGVSSAATLARIIPRVNAWAVTGTPVKDDIKDLWGLLLFLRYEPYASFPKVWNRLTNENQQGFHALFNTIALRHSKRLIRSELELPAQKRFVITVPLSAVEERWYASMLDDVAQWCGLTPSGKPIKGDWDPNDSVVIERMKTALDRLRKTALHPTTLPGGPPGLGRAVAGPMRTVAEVLEAMIEQNQGSATLSRRAALANKLTQGQFFENSPRVKEALTLWEAALLESDEVVAQSRERLHVLIASMGDNEASNGKSQAESEDSADFETPSTQVSEAQRSLRYALEIQHRAVFLCASAYFQIRSNADMTEPDSDEFRRLEKLETDGYDRAKLIRSEILQEARSRALRVMEKITKRPLSKKARLFSDHQFKAPKGITLRHVTERIDMLGQCLNDQAHFINGWREKAIELVLKDLLDQDDNEVTGEEFADSTQVQEELMVFITVLRVAIQDRKAALIGHASTYVAEDEVRRAYQQAEAGTGPSPAKMLDVLARREAIRPRKELSCVQALVTELRDIGLRLKREAQWRGGPQAESPEEILVHAETSRMQSFLDAQNKALSTINQDILDLTSAMNARIEFYRQLQAVSDTVAPYEGRTDDATLALVRQEGDKLTKKAATAESQLRYLMTLKANDQGQETHMCIICQESFSVGVLTVCGHAYCKDCLNEWFKMKRTCPQCKRLLSRADLHDITLKPQEFGFHLEDSNQSTWKKDPKASSIYTMFNDQSLADIRNIDLAGMPLTAKTAMIVKHLIWMRTADPKAKTIIFSQYPSFLDTLAGAFAQHHISFATFNEHNGIRTFKEDPTKECFLLHARAHASGLNLVNASHVILCEPLLNTALELQAIARVHRIGQRRATTVWLYIVEDTVEESVYTLSVRRRMRHMQGNAMKYGNQQSFGGKKPALEDESLEISNTEEIEKAKLGSLMMKRQRGQEYGGEAVANGDLYECLFGKPLSAMGENPADEGRPGLESIRDVPLVRRHLVGEAAEERRDNGEGSSRGAGRA